MPNPELVADNEWAGSESDHQSLEAMADRVSVLDVRPTETLAAKGTVERLRLQATLLCCEELSAGAASFQVTAPWLFWP